MRPIAFLAILVACAPAPAERLRNPKRVTPVDEDVGEPATSTVVVARERPELDITAPAIHIDITLVEPDPSHEIRWPLGLSDHPELAPQYDIARVLAEPGLDWIELCKMGAYKRTSPKLRDQLMYLRAWCYAGNYDYVTAIDTLVKLRNTVVPGLATAIRADMSNMLVSHDPDSARELVNKLGLRSDLDVLDRLAATYVEVGKMSGAIEINELALANDTGASPAKTCQRLTRRVLLEPDTYRSSESAFSKARPLPGFSDDPTPLLFGAKLNTDAQCKELDAQVSCWLVKGNCSAWYKLRGVAEEDAFLLDASAAWPSGKFRANADAWWHVINPALKARPKKEAYEFALLAAKATLELTDCDDTFGVQRVRDTLSRLINDDQLPEELAKRVQEVDDNRHKLCFKPD